MGLFVATVGVVGGVSEVSVGLVCAGGVPAVLNDGVGLIWTVMVAGGGVNNFFFREVRRRVRTVLGLLCRDGGAEPVEFRCSGEVVIVWWNCTLLLGLSEVLLGVCSSIC